MSFPRYPDYKDSGVQWLPNIPIHWEFRRFKQVFAERGERSIDGSEELLSVSAYYGVKPRMDTLEEGDHLSRAESLAGYKICAASDLVMNIMLAWNRGLGFAWQEGIVSPAYSVFYVIDDSQPKFLDYLLRSDEMIRYYKAYSSGVIDSRLRLYPETFGRLHVAMPPSGEQTQIASFLDHETAKIDTLIREQERLIALLREKRQAMALSVYDTDEWQEIRMGNAVDVMHRPVYQVEGEEYTALGLFNRGRGLFHKEPKAMGDIGDSDFFWIKPGDLILSGQFAWEGAVALAGEKEAGTVVSHRYPVIRGKNGFTLTEYIYALLTTSHGDFLLNENSRGAAGRNRPLNLGSLLKEKIKIPPIAVQAAVAELIRSERSIKEEAARQKSFLLEHRSALISAAVTGKIDVRNWQPPSQPAATESEQEVACG